MNSIIDMTYSKSTKGTHVYSANDPDAPITTVYIKRNDLPTPHPEIVKITMEHE